MDQHVEAGADGDARAGLAGLDAVAVKPSEHDLSLVPELPVDTVAVDYEGREHLPEPAALGTLADAAELRVTTPVRADGFDPLGDDSLLDAIPDAARRVLVAGHPAYLTDAERERDVAPRIGAAVDSASDPWIGTEQMERLALAAGGTQYALLDPTTERRLRTLRSAGLDEPIAVYAPVVLEDDEDVILDAVGDYAARREPVADALPDVAATDASASGRAREVLTEAVRDYALVGQHATVRERALSLRDAGATTVVGYPARGVSALR